MSKKVVRTSTIFVPLYDDDTKRVRVDTTTATSVVPNFKRGDVVFVRYVNERPTVRSYVSDSESDSFFSDSDDDSSCDTNRCKAIVMECSDERPIVTIAWVITDRNDIVMKEPHKYPDAWRTIGSALGVIDTCVVDVHMNTIERNAGSDPVYAHKCYDSHNGCVSSKTSTEFLTSYH